METLTLQTAKQVTTEQLAQLLKNITKSTICSIEYIVDDSRSKTIKGQKQVQKHVAISHVYLNHDYTKKVQNLTGDTTFHSFELRGKTRISGTLLISDKTGELMIDGKVLNGHSAKVLNYFHNGEVITEAEAIAKELWTDSYFNPAPVKTMGRGLVDEADDFRIINPYLNKLVKVKLEGQTYEIIK